MSPTQWQQIRALVDQALQQPEAQRLAYLRAHAEVPFIHDEAAALLAHYDATNTLLDTPLVLRRSSPSPLTTVGPYRLVEEIGRGGMGIVYLAERNDGLFEHRVAVKVLPLTHATDQSRLRFDAERRILARLEHPNIARLLDGGITDEGVPFLVMEYVDGMPFTRYCNTHRLTIDERLRLFEQIIEAVGYAHSRLVIHRDLKPSNILVDTDGHVKLLDFGIAKLLASDSPGAMPVTQTGIRALTPNYAAPEQLTGAPISTATDVYAMGVLLYEVLTDHRPHTRDIRTGDTLLPVATPPVRPSKALTEATRTATDRSATSAARRSRLDALRRRLTGDLDVICLKALRTEPERRYASADAFLEDLRRHAADLPIRARPDTLSYRVGKYVQRHRGGVGAAIVLLVASVFFGVVYTTNVQQERDRAQAEQAKAEQAITYLTDLFLLADPGQALGEALTVRTLLDKGRAHIDALAETPALQDEMYRILGVIHLRLNQFDQAAPLLEAAVAGMAERLPPDAHDLLIARLDLADLYFAMGDHERSAAVLADAKLPDQPTASVPADVFVRATTLASGVALLQGDLAEVEQLYAQSVPWLLGEQPALSAASHGPLLFQWADRLLDVADYAEAERLLDEAAPRIGEAYPEAHPNTLLLLHAQLKLQQYRGAYDSTALAIAQRLDRLAQQLYPDGHANVVMFKIATGAVYSGLNQYAAAEAAYTEALAALDALQRPNHPDRLIIHDALAHMSMLKGDFEQAAAEVAAGQRIADLHLRPDHPYRGPLLSQAARLAQAYGDNATADSLFGVAVQLLRGPAATQPFLLYGALNQHARLKVGLGEPAAAVQLYAEAAEGFAELLGATNGHSIIALTNVATVLRNQGRYDEAVARYEQLLALGDGLQPTRRASLLLGIGKTHLALDQPAQALPHLDEALTLRRAHYPEGDWRIGSAAGSLGDALVLLERMPEAEPLLVEAYETILARRGPAHSATAGRQAALTAFYRQTGRVDQAVALQTANVTP
ncbi:MAG: serine/threonine-protein kinase [Bacteroidota bacterium]